MRALQGRRDEALQQLKDLRCQGFPPSHPDLLEAERLSAAILVELGRFEEAEELYKDLVTLCETSLGQKHPWTLKFLCELGNVFYEQHEFKDGEMCLRKALASYQEIFDLTHRVSMSCLADLAIVLASPKRCKEHRQVETAEAYLQHASAAANAHLRETAFFAASWSVGQTSC